MLDLKEEKFLYPGRREEGKTFYGLQILGLIDDVRDGCVTMDTLRPS